MKPTHVLAGAALGITLLLLGAAAPAQADNLLVQLRTRYVPYKHFFRVRTRLVSVPRDESRTRVAPFGDFLGHDFTVAVTVAGFADVPSGDYDLDVELLDRDLRIVHSAPRVSFRFPDTRVILAEIERLPGPHKVVEHAEDRDRDFRISPGDVLRYAVDATSYGRFEDEPGVGGRLVPDSVRTTTGTVLEGNGADDRKVVVAFPGIVTFDVEVAPAVHNQGRAGAHLTDDPTTEEIRDATVTPVSCAYATCAQERDALKDDSDKDGVIAAIDLCPKTKSGAAVDDRGCSQAQFCSRFDTASESDRQICNAADWQGNEVLSASPDDCRAVRNTDPRIDRKWLCIARP